MSKTLTLLYHTMPGRLLLKPLTGRTISKICGKFLDSRLSLKLVPAFIKSNHIDVTDYELKKIASFNDFFSRQIKPEARPIDVTPNALIAPCDGYLSVYDIEHETVLPVKQSHYTIPALLKSKKLAQKFEGGKCLVFRLCVNHYHRYHYIDSGVKSENRFIPGKLHTVRPIALRTVPVFTENCREYTLIQTQHFGTVVQMEVGAMLVGRIVNYDGAGPVNRGDEKGRFEYGGSTIIVLLQRNAATLLPEFAPEKPNLSQQTNHDCEPYEVPVRFGQKIGYSNHTSL